MSLQGRTLLGGLPLCMDLAHLEARVVGWVVDQCCSDYDAEESPVMVLPLKVMLMLAQVHLLWGTGGGGGTAGQGPGGPPGTLLTPVAHCPPQTILGKHGALQIFFGGNFRYEFLILKFIAQT